MESTFSKPSFWVSMLVFGDAIFSRFFEWVCRNQGLRQNREWSEILIANRSVGALKKTQKTHLIWDLAASQHF